MAKVHAVFNQKGGVGKTLISMNMGAVTSDVLGPDENGDAQVAVAVWDPQKDAVWWANRVADLPFEVVPLDGETLRDLKDWPYRHIFVDTPGFVPLDEEQIAAGLDPLGEGNVADMIRMILDQSDDVIVPIMTEGQTYAPTWNTIEHVVKPRRLPFQVVINNWAPGEGEVYVRGTRTFCEGHGWPVARTVIRRYRVHTNASVQGRVVTQYHQNRLELQAREDFYKFALEHGMGAAAGRLEEIERMGDLA